MMLIKKSTYNMNQSEKNGSAPNYIEKKSLSDEKFRIAFNFESYKKPKQVAKRLNKFDKKLYEWEKKDT